MVVKRFISSDKILDLLAERGLIDTQTKRVVIDIKAGDFPAIYVQSLGDEDLFVELITNLAITQNPTLPRVQDTEDQEGTTEARDKTDNDEH